MTPDEQGDSSVNARDAAGDVDDAGTREAGACSASKICVTAVPIGGHINLTAVWGSSATDVWAVGSDSTVLHYDGAVWEKAARAGHEVAGYTLRSVWLERPDDVWMADGNRIRHSEGWRGPSATEWSFHTYSTSELLPAAIRGRGDTIWLARGLGGRGAPLVKFEGWADGGPATAESLTPDFFVPLTAIALGPTADELWGAGGNRILRVSRADASAPGWEFEEHDSRTVKRLFGVWSDDVAVWIVGEGGTIRRTQRSAAPTRTFEIVPSDITADLYGIFGFAPNDIWTVGEDSTVVHWDGTTWTRVPTPFDDASKKPRLLAVWGHSPNDLWIAGHGTMLHLGEDAR